MDKIYAAQLVEVGRALEILAEASSNIRELSFKPAIKKREVTIIIKRKVGISYHVTVACSKTQYFNAEELLQAMLQGINLLQRLEEATPGRKFLVIKLGK